MASKAARQANNGQLIHAKIFILRLDFLKIRR